MWIKMHHRAIYPLWPRVSLAYPALERSSCSGTTGTGTWLATEL